MIRIPQSTIDSNVRMSRIKVDILTLVDDKHPDVTQAEWEVVLAELATDAARYRLRDERKALEEEDE